MPAFRRTKPLLIAANILVILSVLATAAFVFIQFQSSASADTGPCRQPGKKYQLNLQADAFSRPALHVQRCDSIDISNLDGLPYYLNFGKHENHIAYPGYTAKALQQHESVVIVAQQTGTFELHDHIRDKAVLVLTVSPQ
jgi:hypothetical protein